MTGFIVDVKDAKREDKVVTIITDREIKKYYRFFGARHSILKVGNLINFRIENKNGSYMPNLRELTLVDSLWIEDEYKRKIWQEFIYLILYYLNRRGDISSFYYELLLKSNKKFEKQNPKRVVCDSYIELLSFDKKIREFKHQDIPHEKIERYIQTQKSLYLNDNEIDILYKMIIYL